MDLSAIFSRARKATLNNSPLILTAIGVTGSVTTAVLAYRAGMKVQRILDKEHHHFLDEEMSKVDILKKELQFTWKMLIPPIGSGIATVTCIVMANRVSTRRSAALASAYMIVQEGFAEYKTKVVEKLGENKEEAIRKEIAEDRVRKNPPPTVIIGAGNVLCSDSYSGRYFMSDRETIREAVNDVNHQILNGDYPSLTDFWDAIGLARTADSDEFGWDTDNLLRVAFTGGVADDGRPFLQIDYLTYPVRNYYKYS